MSLSLLPHGLQPTRLLCLWDSPGKKTGVGCHALLRASSGPETDLTSLASLALAGGFFTTNENEAIFYFLERLGKIILN